MQYILGIPVIGFVVMFIMNIVLALLLAVTYNGLSKENLVASIKFKTIDDKDKIYIATVFDDGENEIGEYKIYGDQWRMDAGFIKMSYFGNIIGLDSKYTLNRFEGRYSDIKEENSKTHKSYQLEEHDLIENFGFFFDTTYGSSVYKNIKQNTLFTVLHSPTGLLVREKEIQVEKKEKSFIDSAIELFN